MANPRNNIYNYTYYYYTQNKTSYSLTIGEYNKLIAFCKH